ncbi:MAG TPA: hypothetical protein K8W04_08265, partial [Bacteroides reticulotermitis]|nr:hypothetical protein [Bacteroides reticulotermitis]
SGYLDTPIELNREMTDKLIADIQYYNMCDGSRNFGSTISQREIIQGSLSLFTKKCEICNAFKV